MNLRDNEFSHSTASAEVANDARRAVIHIGYPKTASTTLKSVFLDPCPEIFVAKDTRFLVYKDDVALSEHERIAKIDKIRRDFDESGKSSLAISREDLSMGPWLISKRDVPLLFDQPENIARKLRNYFDEAIILMILRPQHEWIESWFRHLIRVFETRSLSRLLESRDFRENVGVSLHYGSTLKLYLEHFGPDKVHVLFLDQLRQTPTDFWSKLARIYGVAFTPRHTVVENPAMSLNAARAKLIGNRIYSATVRPLRLSPVDRLYQRAWKARYSSPRGAASADGFVGEAERRLIADIYRDSNAELARLLSVDLSRFGFPS